jgi:hypothetical protein
MPLEIRLNSQFQIRPINNEPKILELPTIELVPIGNIFITSINFIVQGNPPEIATKIQSAYPQLNFSDPLTLQNIQRLKNDRCPLDQPLNSDVNCTLTVTVNYLDGDLEKTITSTCQMWFNLPQKTAPEIEYPGWSAIDFGTSNTTITQFDPHEVIQRDLPFEQEECLRLKVKQWLTGNIQEILPQISGGEWQQFLTDLARNLGVNNEQDLLTVDLLEILRQIELNLSNRSEVFRQNIQKKLHEIYAEVFRVPPLQSQNLIPVILDQNRRQSEIASELEIINFDPKLTVLMGERAKQNRNNAIAQATNSNFNDILSKFYHSPKRYIGTDKDITIKINDKEITLKPNQLIQSAYAHLIDLVEEYRQKNQDNLAKGKFNKVVMTYPTVAPPIVRQDIENLIKNLGINEVQTAYDEAVSVAIFFLWRQFGGNLNVGIESFKTRCHFDGSQWSQNLLVLDIGGGTTDIALINLTLSEINPFQPHEDRGAGGRYYVLTPKILGASGHLQLGGELITLRVLRWLKIAIADTLLTAVQNSDLTSDYLQSILTSLDEKFLTDGKFVPGSLLQTWQQTDPKNDAINTDVLSTAEKVIHTRWVANNNYLQPFYTLWEYAEKAKLHFGKPEPGEFILSEQEISQLLDQNNLEYQINNPEKLRINLTQNEFNKIAQSVIVEAINIAKGLMENRLKMSAVNQEKVDWLILSGKTCNLPQVQEEIYQEFSQSPYFIWNPERITFVPEYTKLATSAGACYAEKLRQLIFSPESSKEILRKGANQLYIDVKNLFYYLPCSFILKPQNEDSFLPIFKAGQELYQISSTLIGEIAIAKARSQWMGTQLRSLVYRSDYVGGDKRFWGSFNGQALALKLGMSEFQFRNQVQVQFEIDQKLQIDLLLCQGKPHYKIVNNLPKLKVENELFVNNQSSWQIAVNVLESSTVDSQNSDAIFDDQTEQEWQTFRYFTTDNKPKKTIKGLISKPLPEFPHSGKHTFFLSQIDPETQEKKWLRIGELNKPNINGDFPCKYYATLDEQGTLIIHGGDVPYCESNNPESLKFEGWVYRSNLELQPQDIDIKRDPFSGQH